MVEFLIYIQAVGGSNPSRPTIICGCAAEWLGPGLQIRSMQVRVLSPTPTFASFLKLVGGKSLTSGPYRILTAILISMQMKKNVSCLTKMYRQDD